MESSKTKSLNYRYFGDISVSNADSNRSLNTGIITAATLVDRVTKKVHVGINLLAPGVRFDKEFCRIIATYRLMTFVSQSAEEFTKHTDEFRLGLEALKYRIKKSMVRVRKTDEEYKAERIAAGIPARVGYYKYDIQYFGVSDFALNSKFAFSLDIVDDATHDDIDLVIIDKLLNTELPKWTSSVLESAKDAIEFEDDGDSDVTAESINAELIDLKLVNGTDGFYVVPDSYDPCIENSITPIMPDRNSLLEWLDETLRHTIQFSPAIDEFDAEDEFDVEDEDDNDDAWVDGSENTTGEDSDGDFDAECDEDGNTQDISGDLK